MGYSHVFSCALFYVTFKKYMLKTIYIDLCIEKFLQKSIYSFNKVPLIYHTIIFYVYIYILILNNDIYY